MKSAMSLSLKFLFKTFVFANLFCFLFELIFLKLINNLKPELNINFEILVVVLTASFLMYIFSKKTIVNYLFINGCSRKRIAFVINFSCLIYSVLFFLLYIIYGFFYKNITINMINLYTLVNFLIIFFSINLISEFAIFLNLLYKNISMRKGKGVNKFLYKYVYSFIFIIFTYSYRIIYENIKIHFNDMFFIVLLIFVFLTQILFIYINKNKILNIDIRV